VPFHRLRHTFASRLYDDHKDIRKVSEWLGHTEATFTLRTCIHEVDPVLGDAPSWGLAA
jgi:integrase